jgi:hypothetical protein
LPYPDIALLSILHCLWICKFPRAQLLMFTEPP